MCFTSITLNIENLELIMSLLFNFKLILNYKHASSIIIRPHPPH